MSIQPRNRQPVVINASKSPNVGLRQPLLHIMKSEAYGESALRFHVPAMQSGQAEEKLAVERE